MGFHVATLYARAHAMVYFCQIAEMHRSVLFCLPPLLLFATFIFVAQRK